MRRDLARRPPAADAARGGRRQRDARQALPRHRCPRTRAHSSSSADDRRPRAISTVSCSPRSRGSSRPMRRSSRRSRGARCAAKRSHASTRSGSTPIRVAAAFRDGAPDRFSLDGATGQVTLRRPPVRARGPLRGVSRRPADARSMAPADAPHLARGHARAEGARRRLPGAARPRDRRPQFPHAPRRDRPRSRATATRSCSSRCACARGGDFGGAADSVTAAKRARWIAAAQAYLATLGREPPCRFDVVLLDALDPSRIVWERDVVEDERLLKSPAMIDYEKRIREHFADSARLKLDAADALAPQIARAARVS